LAQIKKKFWKNALGDAYTDADNDAVGAPHTEVEDSERMKSSPKRLRRGEPEPAEKEDAPPTTSRAYKESTRIRIP
jgi:hypothetical protein